MLRVSTAHLIGLPGLVEPAGREFADRLEHPEPLVPVAEEALVDQRLHGVQIGLGDFLGSVQRAAASKHGQPGEQALLLFGEQVVAPCDRCSKRCLAGLSVPSPLQQVQSLGEPLEDLGRREDARTGRRQFDGQGEVVERPGELGDRIVGRQLGSGTEQFDRLREGERRDRELHLPSHPKDLAGCDQKLEVGAGLD